MAARHRRHFVAQASVASPGNHGVHNRVSLINRQMLTVDKHSNGFLHHDQTSLFDKFSKNS